MTDLEAGLVLVYHAVAAGAAREPVREVVPVVPVELFDAQMRHVAARHRIVAGRELHSAIAARKRGERFPVAVTFDDDLREHLEVALPALRRAGVTATFFLTGASLERPTSFWWERLQRAIDAGLPLPDDVPDTAAATMQALSAKEREAASEDLLRRLGGEPPEWGLQVEDTRALAEAGFDIGFHTREHHVLTELDDHELDHAMRAGRAELEAAAGCALLAVAYPHGKADARVANAARAAGYAVGFTTEGAAVVPDTDRLLTGRVYPSSDSLGHFALQSTRVLWRARRERR